MFPRIPHPDLVRLSQPDVPPDEMERLVHYWPIAVLESPSLPMLAIERPDVWKSVVLLATNNAAQQWAADHMSRTLIVVARLDNYLNLSRVLTDAAKQLDIRRGHATAGGRWVDLLAGVENALSLACDREASEPLFKCATRAIELIAQHVETPWTWYVEQAAIYSRLSRIALPSALEPYVQPWPDWPSWDYVLSQPHENP